MTGWNGRTQQMQDAAKAEEPASAPNPEAAKVSLFGLLRGMSIGEWAALVAVLASLGGGAMAAGAWLERQQRDAAVAAALQPVEAELSGLKDRHIALQSEQAALLSANAAMEKQVRALIGQSELDAAFTTFAQNYINHLAGGGPQAKAILVDYVCALFRESQIAGKEVGFEPISLEAIVEGDFEMSLNDLRDAGYNPRLVQELRDLRDKGATEYYRTMSRLLDKQIGPRVSRNPNARPTPGPKVDPEAVSREVIDMVDSEVGQMIKTVTFPGRPPFTLPPEVSLAVHRDPACRVR